MGGMFGLWPIVSVFAIVLPPPICNRCFPLLRLGGLVLCFVIWYSLYFVWFIWVGFGAWRSHAERGSERFFYVVGARRAVPLCGAPSTLPLL